MKLITFQHKDVLDKINKGKYTCDIKSKYQGSTPKSYDILRKRLIDKTGECENPIFAWVKVLPEGELEVNNKTIGRALEMTSFNFEDYVILELEVDDSYVDLQDFYCFVDLRCEEEGFDCYYDSFDEFPIDTIFDISTAKEIQATLPMIKPEWVKSIYNFVHINKNNVNIIKIK